MTEALDLRLDPEEVERMILSLGAIGAHSGTGVWRTAYSPEWDEANSRVESWAREAGLSVRRDAVGNVWARAEGTHGGKAVVSGSHIDSQCPGGRYDGALGVVAALAAVRALTERFGLPRRPVEVVSLCEEEGSRFPTASFWGSRAITGRIAPEDPDRIMGLDGASIAEAMRDRGLDPARVTQAQRDDLGAFIELHIEQGPILEHAGRSVGIVTGITGIRHTEVRLLGEANHAGAFPMDLRRDPMAGFAEMASGLINHAHRLGRPAVTTVGRIAVNPNGAAIVPGEVTFTLDARHPDAADGERMHEVHAALMQEVAERRGLGLSSRVLLDHPACPSDPAILRALREAAPAEGLTAIELHSGAGHDAQQMARICPVAMIFVRSKDGRSHTPEEFSSMPDIMDGVRLLAATLYRLAWTT